MERFERQRQTETESPTIIEKKLREGNKTLVTEEENARLGGKNEWVYNTITQKKKSQKQRG